MLYPILMIGSCLFCASEFKKRRKTTKYCSRHCQAKDLAARGISCKKPKTGQQVNCKLCGKSFYVQLYRIKKGDVCFCSRSCHAKDRLIPLSKPFKKTGRPKHKYKSIKVDGKWVREHRYIMEQFLGRKLESWEHVHHINDNSLDNRIENLQVLSNSEHQKIEYKFRN